MSARSTAVLALIAAAGVSACGLIPWSVPGRHLSAQLVDAETRRPIVGAAVNLRRQVACFRFVHGVDFYSLPTLETTTDADGRFELVAPSTRPRAGCGAPGWGYRLLIVAPGYFPVSAEEDSEYENTGRPLRFATLELHRIRYAADLKAYDPANYPDREDYRSGSPQPSEDNPILNSTIEKARNTAFTPVGPMGVFASSPNATFDRVAVVEVMGPTLITLAQDGATGTIFRWTADGENVARQDASGARLVGGWQEIPAVERDHQLYLAHSSFEDPGDEDHWYSAPTQFGDVVFTVVVATLQDTNLLTLEGNGFHLALYDLNNFIDNLGKQNHPPRIAPGPPVEISTLLDGGNGPIECLTKLDPTKRLFFVAHGRSERALFASTVQSGLRAYRVQLPPDALDAQVTACVASRARNVLYVAQRGLGLRRFELKTDQKGWKYRETIEVSPATALTYPDLPNTFVSLAVGQSTTVEVGMQDRREVVYAVANDNSIYRFTNDLQPDQRLRIDGSAGTEPSNH